MKTSDLHSRMYAMPLRTMNQQQQMLMQKLHSTLDLPTTATCAPNAPSCNGFGPISSSWHAPYLKRVRWLLMNSQGQYLAAIDGNQLSWVAYPNGVPEPHRYSTHQRAKSVWVQLSEVLSSQDFALAVRPVDFYAHPASPHLWCALDDQL